MNYYKDIIEDNPDILERYELMIERIQEISSYAGIAKPYKDYFSFVANFILEIDKIMSLVKEDKIENCSLSVLTDQNKLLYQDILPENYKMSYGNPDYICNIDGFKNKEIPQMLCYLYSEIRGMIVYAYEGRIVDITLYAELFVQAYSLICDFAPGNGEVEEQIIAKELHSIIYYFNHDYAQFFVTYRIRQQLDPVLIFAKDIVMEADLEDISYLYRYGEYIGKNELETAKFLNTFSQQEIDAMASTYTEGFRMGFEAARIDLSKKKTVNIRYSIGQERLVRAAIIQFEKMGLEPVLFRYAVNRINRKLIHKVGYIGTAPNKQYEYDHRMDQTLFMDKNFAERKLEVLRQAYSTYEYQAKVYAGPACIETFGEIPFEPQKSLEALSFTDKQQEISVNYSTEASQIVNEYISRDNYSFTIIAYPIPEIGDKYEEIFKEIVKVNTLDNALYREIHQNIIQELDKAEFVHVMGRDGNETDMVVAMHEMKNPEKETNFENCVADVNIPVGEVFTSPKLGGTKGVLNVSEVYLDNLKYKNLKLYFEDGKIKDYFCDNYENPQENKNFIKENLLAGRNTLPIGEFAIGTNTTAYVMANKFDIVYKLPILIVEKMGPHFAVGDTCYSYSENNILYNPDGKEIVAKDNECSLLRNEDITKAYFNCHTDITIPYDEIGLIESVHFDGSTVPIIMDGRFVLPGTEKLNLPFEK